MRPKTIVMITVAIILVVMIIYVYWSLINVLSRTMFLSLI